MRGFVRLATILFSLVSFASSIALLSVDRALAQNNRQQQAPPAQAAPRQPPAFKQIALTDKQIEGVLVASKDVDAITSKLPDNARPDPKIIAQLDGVAKKNGFSSYGEYSSVLNNIGVVMAGFDPVSKKYVGREAVIKAQIAQLQADKKMPAQEKNTALADLNQALKAPAPPIENKGNIDLVAKYYDKLAAALGEDQE
jgi:hypothetical protein